MQYRHPSGARLALTSGHVTRVGPEWKELDPMFHAAALIARCEVNQGVIPAIADVPPPAPSPQAVVNVDEETVIRKALIHMLERNSEADDFTNAGLPNLKVVRRVAGTEVDKGQVYRIFEELKAEAAASAAAAEPAVTDDKPEGQE